ncbi:MAG: YfcE family phosphodiesterase [Bacilli bacterium]|nr:YfcE family phosphodiesterase [Bacilli bacterium]
MKLVVFSDAHGDRKVIERIIKFNMDADYFISLGDSELPHKYLLDLDVLAIKGNYPHDAGFVYEKMMDIEGKKVLLTHGHKQDVNNGLVTLCSYAMKQNADIVLYGHTHIARVDHVQEVTLINPGSISKPRADIVPSYLILKITKDSVEYAFKEAYTNIDIHTL